MKKLSIFALLITVLSISVFAQRNNKVKKVKEVFVIIDGKKTPIDSVYKTLADMSAREFKKILREQKLDIKHLLFQRYVDSLNISQMKTRDFNLLLKDEVMEIQFILIEKDFNDWCRRVDESVINNSFDMYKENDSVLKTLNNDTIKGKGGKTLPYKNQQIRVDTLSKKMLKNIDDTIYIKNIEKIVIEHYKKKHDNIIFLNDFGTADSVIYYKSTP